MSVPSCSTFSTGEVTFPGLADAVNDLFPPEVPAIEAILPKLSRMEAPRPRKIRRGDPFLLPERAQKHKGDDIAAEFTSFVDKRGFSRGAPMAGEIIVGYKILE